MFQISFQFRFTFPVSTFEKKANKFHKIYLASIWRYVTAISDKIFEPVKKKQNKAFS